MTALGLVDSNVLVSRYDPRFPEKRQTASRLLRRGIEEDNLRLPHQAIVEFVAATTRPLGLNPPLLSRAEAFREAEELLAQMPVLYPDEELLRIAIRGAATYQLAWFDAHLWAYAERYGLSEIHTEDFEHGRLYGKVRIVDPFLESG